MKNPGNPLTNPRWMQPKERENAVREVCAEDPETGSWLRKLLEREGVLQQSGNAYGEIYSSRQVSLATGAIAQREQLRARILHAAREHGLTLVQLAELLGMPPGEVLPHVVALRRRNQLLLERVDGQTPFYRAVPLKGEA